MELYERKAQHDCAEKFYYCCRRCLTQPASLLQACLLAVIKSIPGYIFIACSGLMTSLLQVVSRLAASSLSKLCMHKLDACCFNNQQQVWTYHVASSLIFTGLMKMMKPTGLMQLDEILAPSWWNPQLAPSQGRF